VRDEAAALLGTWYWKTKAKIENPGSNALGCKFSAAGAVLGSKLIEILRFNGRFVGIMTEHGLL
jgi:hypothetical protein